MEGEAGQIIVSADHLLVALGVLIAMLWGAVKIILTLVERKLQSDQIATNQQIKALIEAIKELKETIRLMDERVGNISEGLAVAKDRLNRQ